MGFSGEPPAWPFFAPSSLPYSTFVFLKTLMMEILQNIGSGLRSGVLFTRCCGMYTHSSEGLISLLRLGT